MRRVFCVMKSDLLSHLLYHLDKLAPNLLHRQISTATQPLLV
jgi:hypothetical protein